MCYTVIIIIKIINNRILTLRIFRGINKHKRIVQMKGLTEMLTLIKNSLKLLMYYLRQRRTSRTH